MSQNMTIRTNMTSLTAHRNIKNTGLQQRRAANRLASGFRINSAADDAAGLAISENMRAQIRGLNQAIRNAQDGISLIQTAEGGLASINDIIIRMREIVVQASNDTYTLMQRTMLQAEIDQLINEIDSLSHRVEFNGKRLLARALTGVNSHSAIAPPILMSAQTATIQPLSIPPIPDITLNINTLADGESGTGWNFADGVLNITGGGIFQIDGTGASTTNRITVASGVDADVILNNVLINTDTGAALDMREANVNLWLAANSTNIMSTTHEHSAGIQTTGGTLVLDGTGSVVATGGSGVGSGSGSGAGIGGGTDADGGVIVINGGNITAHGGAGLPGVGGGGISSAGIGSGGGTGGGGGNFGGNITINGGNVTAFGGGQATENPNGGAGIGGGNGSCGGIITINGGVISAIGGSGLSAAGGSMGAAGMGGGAGMGGRSGIIVINGGDIIAVGGDLGGSGIGGGAVGMIESIIINGGAVRAISHGSSAAIGGLNTTSNGTIAINGGVVVADALGTGAAVGGSVQQIVVTAMIGQGANLTITGGVLEIINGWIGGGTGATDHGTLTYLNGNLSISDWTTNIPGGVWNDAGNPLFEFEVSLPNLTPYQVVTFVLNIAGQNRTFNAITDRNGEIFVFIPDLPTLLLPLLSDPSSNRTGATTGTVTVTANMPGDLFFLVLDQGATMPDADTIINTGQQATGASGSNTLSITGIPTYDARSVFMVLRDEDGNLSDIVRVELAAYVPVGNGNGNGDNGGTPPTRPPLPLPPTRQYKRLWLQTGANSKQGMHVSLPSIDAHILGLRSWGISNINVVRQCGREISLSLDIIDRALTYTTKARARLGAYQNRLEHTMRSLAISSENLQDSESRIRNADIAREKMHFFKTTILQQTGILMLAQANQGTQMLLMLLR